jgi:hypothetical protein
VITRERTEVAKRVAAAASDIQNPSVGARVESFVLGCIVDPDDERTNVMVDERVPQDTIVE